jgi:hypothetical protein
MLERIPKKDPNNAKRMIVDPKDPKRIFTATSRDAEGTTLNIEFNLENNSWEFMGEVGLDKQEAALQQTHRERILNVLQANLQRPLSGPEIMELLGVTREQRGPIYSELGRMENKRLISSKPAPGDKRYNLYFLPNFEAIEIIDTVTVAQKNSLPPPPPTPTVSIANYSSESHTVYGLENSQQNSQQIVSKNPECDSYKIAETPSDKSINPIVSNFSLSQGGEGVKCTSDTETVTEVNVELSHQIPITLPPTAAKTPTPPTVPVIAPLEPIAQSVPPLANQATEPDIEIGDRVVIARSDNHRYRNETGEVIDSCLGTKGEKKFLVRFDKKISNIFRDILQDYFPATDVIPIAHDFANRIFAAIGYQSPAVASAIKRELSEAIGAGKLTLADVLAIIGAAEFARFERLMGSHGTT